MKPHVLDVISLEHARCEPMAIFQGCPLPLGHNDNPLLLLNTLQALTELYSGVCVDGGEIARLCFNQVQFVCLAPQAQSHQITWQHMGACLCAHVFTQQGTPVPPGLNAFITLYDAIATVPVSLNQRHSAKTYRPTPCC